MQKSNGIRPGARCMDCHSAREVKKYPVVLKVHTCLLYTSTAGSRATVRVGSPFTSTFPTTIGVKQGDTLSSLLLDLVLEAAINKLEIREHIGIKTTQILPYTYDVDIVSRSRNSLKEVVIKIYTEAMKRGLKVNDNKTKYMEITKTLCSSQPLQFEN